MSETPLDQKVWFDQEQAAEYLKISVPTLLRWKPPFTRRPGTRRKLYHRETLDAWQLKCLVFTSTAENGKTGPGGKSPPKRTPPKYASPAKEEPFSATLEKLASGKRERRPAA